MEQAAGMYNGGPLQAARILQLGGALHGELVPGDVKLLLCQ